MKRRDMGIVFVGALFTLVTGCSAGAESQEPASANAEAPLSAGGDPLFKMLLQDSQRLDHFYTTDWNEVMAAQAAGYLDYGPVGRCFSSQIAGTIPLYRLYSNVAVDHFYTTSEAEAESAAASGYAHEGIACFVFPENAPGTCPFYRYYDPGSGGHADHFYTESGREGALATQYGYRYEGIAAFLSPYGDSCPN